MDIDYNKLKTFLTVVSLSSVTKAAESLHRTQSAVSQAVKGLEAQLGLKLIEWEGKKMRLTGIGRQVFEAAVLRMEAMEEELEALVQSKDAVGGTLTLGVLADGSTDFLNKLYTIIASFRKKHPAAHFCLQFLTSQEIENGLLEERLDLGFLINFQKSHRFLKKALVQETHILVSNQKNSSLEELHFIDIDKHYTCLGPWFEKYFPKKRKKLLARPPIAAAPNFHAIKALVLAGVGAAILPRFLIEDEVKAGKLFPLYTKGKTLEVRLDLAQLLGRENRLIENIFIDEISNSSIFKPML